MAGGAWARCGSGASCGLGSEGALVAVGIFLPLLALLCCAGAAPPRRESRRPSADADLLSALPIFAPLPEAPLEALAWRLERKERSPPERRWCVRATRATGST